MVPSRGFLPGLFEGLGLWSSPERGASEGSFFQGSLRDRHGFKGSGV